MWNHRRRWSARTALAVTCLAALIVSGGSTGRIARADEPLTPPRPSAPAAGPAVLVDLGDPAAVATWTTVNDPVMGGRSTSTVTFGDGGLVFSGDISLDNNGGFASARGPIDPELGSRATGATSPPRPASGGPTTCQSAASSRWAGSSIPYRSRRLWTRRSSAGSRSTSSTNRKARSSSLSVPSTRQAEDCPGRLMSQGA